MNQNDQIISFLSYLQPEENEFLKTCNIRELMYLLFDTVEPNKIPMPCDIDTLDFNKYITLNITKVLNELFLYEFGLASRLEKRSRNDFYKSLTSEYKLLAI